MMGLFKKKSIHETIKKYGWSSKADGGSGNDKIYGYSVDKNTLYGGSGNDYVEGWGSRNYLYGGSGSDTIKGKGVYNYLVGGTGSDKLYGYGATNKLYGESGHSACRCGRRSGRYLARAPCGQSWFPDSGNRRPCRPDAGLLVEQIARAAAFRWNVFELGQAVGDPENLLAVKDVHDRLKIQAGDRGGIDVDQAHRRVVGHDMAATGRTELSRAVRGLVEGADFVRTLGDLHGLWCP